MPNVFKTAECVRVRCAGKFRAFMAGLLLLAVLPCCPMALGAQVPDDPHFQWTGNCRQAYQSIMELRLDEGEQLLGYETAENPGNALVHLLANYIDLFTIFITESEAELNARLPNKDRRLQAIGETPAGSPYRRYALAEINLQWAFARIKFDQYFKAFWEARKAFKLLEENARLHPKFFPNQKSLGILHAFAGTLPDKYKWGGKILGISGSIPQGLGEMETFLQQSAQNDYLFYDEGLLMYTFLLVFLQNDHEAAWQVAQGIPTDLGLLNTFVAAQVASRTGHNDYAIEVLSNRPKGKGYLPFPMLDYLLGNCKLNRLDADADVPLKRFLGSFGGKNYVKDAYLKLAWHHLLQGEQSLCEQALQNCISKGSAEMDIDRQATADAKSGESYNLALLKARLLYDGGYYKEAHSVLQTTAAPDFETEGQRLEYHYRLARICDALGWRDQAIGSYLATIEKGASMLPLYYAPKACLQMGMLYEKQGKNDLALQYYRQCLDFGEYRYKNSFDQQAKAGINRIKN